MTKLPIANSRITCCLLVLGVLFGFAPDVNAQRKGKGKDKDAPAAVVVTEAVSDQRLNQQSFVGTLAPIRRSTVGSAVEGRLIELLLEPGQYIESVANESSTEDDEQSQLPLIARIATDTVEIDLKAAQVELKLIQQSLEELQISLPLDIKLAQAQENQALALFDNAKNNLDRIRRVARNGGLSSRELSTAESELLSREQAFMSSQASREKLEATQQVKLKIAQSRVDSQQQAVSQLLDQLDKHQIVAPFAGAVTRKMVDVGDWLPKGSPIIEIVQLDPIEMAVQIPQSLLPELQNSLDQNSEQECEITIDGFEQTFTGKVHSIVPMADIRSRSFPVVVRLTNPQTESGYQLKPGMLGSATLQLGVQREVVLIPKDALILGNDSNRVFIARQNDQGQLQAQSVTVTVGESIGSSVEILDGVSAGDKVVIRGNERLRPGQLLKLLEGSSQ